MHNKKNKNEIEIYEIIKLEVRDYIVTLKRQ